MNTRRPLVVAIIAICIGLAPLGGEAATDARPPSAAPLIRIGVAASLSAGVETLGWRQVNAVHLVVDQVNAAGGIDVGGTVYDLTFDYVDDACDATQAVTAANTLVALGVVAVVGHTCSVASIAAEPIYDAAGIPMISGSSTNPAVTLQGYDIVFRVISNDAAPGVELATFFHEELGLTRAAIVQNNSVWSSYSADGFDQTFTNLGGTITSWRTIGSVSEFNGTLTLIGGENVQAIIYVDPDVHNGAAFSSAALGLGMGGLPIGWIPLGEYGVAILDDYVTEAGSAADGDYAAMSYRRTADMPGYDDFNIDYHAVGFANYGSEDADIWGAFAYDAARIIVDAIQRADSTNPADVRNSIASMTNHVGVVGIYKQFDSHGDVVPQWSWIMHRTSGSWVQVAGTSFSDVLSNHWAYRFIEAILGAGLTAGYPDGTYGPDNSVTRAEMAVFLKKGIHGSSYFPPAPNGSSPFSDLVGHWAEAWMEELYDEGLTVGYPDGTYRPENQVTRAEMAVFLLKAKHGSSYVAPPPSGGSFSDVAGHWAENWIEQLKEEGITSGYPDGTFRPENSVTRAEMAVFLVGAFGLPMP